MHVTTVLLWLIWFACAFAYYGIVLMTTEILQEMKEGTCDATDQCSFNCQDLGRVSSFFFAKNIFGKKYSLKNELYRRNPMHFFIENFTKFYVFIICLK